MPDDDAPRVSVVIVSHDSAGDLAELLPTLTPEVECIVVDSGSRDDSVAAATKLGARTLALPLNLGWARCCNLGAALAAHEVIAFVNPDARPTPGALARLASHLDDTTVGAVAPRFAGADGATQPFYFRFPTPVAGLFCFLTAGQQIDRRTGGRFIRHRTYSFGANLPADVDQPGAACLLVRAREFRRDGGFGNGFFLFFADTDHCVRLRAQGRRVYVAWDVDVVHRGAGSVGQRPQRWVHSAFQRDYVAYARRHYSPLGIAVTYAGVVVLTGLIPIVSRLLRGHVRDAATALRTALEALR